MHPHIPDAAKRSHPLLDFCYRAESGYIAQTTALEQIHGAHPGREG